MQLWPQRSWNKKHRRRSGSARSDDQSWFRIRDVEYRPSGRYVAHAAGPNLESSQSQTPRPAAQKELKQGMTFAFDGFHCWKQPDGTTKTISVEEMAVVTESGAEYLITPQEELILVGGK